MSEEMDDLYEQVTARVTSVALEALQDVYARLPYDTDIPLSNGLTARIEKFVDPEIRERDDGEERPQCAFDVKFPGGHLEFTIELTGWGGAP